MTTPNADYEQPEPNAWELWIQQREWESMMRWHPELRRFCRHCGAHLAHRPGHSGRYRYTDRFDGTDVLGSGCECPKNERGHEPGEEIRWPSTHIDSSGAGE